MPDVTLVTTLLVLFTHAQKAEEIHGDLLEERTRHGSGWYWLQVPVTCILLAIERLRREPALLLMSYALFELALNINWWLLRPLRAAILRNDSLELGRQLILNDLVTASFTFVCALLVTRIARHRAAALILPAVALLVARSGLLFGWSRALGLLPILLGAALGAMLLVRWLHLRAMASEEFKPDDRPHID